MGAMIFARHAGQEKEYVFEVASKDAWPVNRGDFLIVDTMRGIHVVQATSDLVECQDVGLIAQKYGAYTPLKQVLRIIKKEDAEMLLTEFARIKFDEALGRPLTKEDFFAVLRRNTHGRHCGNAIWAFDCFAKRPKQTALCDMRV